MVAFCWLRAIIYPSSVYFSQPQLKFCVSESCKGSVLLVGGLLVLVHLFISRSTNLSFAQVNLLNDGVLLIGDLLVLVHLFIDCHSNSSFE